MAQFAVILPAAGKSTRFGDPIQKKPFVDLKGRPVWVRTADVFGGMDDVVQTIVCIAADDMERFKEKFAANLAFMEVQVVEGGASRAESVERGLSAVREDIDYVAVHDAARPLITRSWVREVFAAAEQHKAAIPAVPIASTIKRVIDSQIDQTVDRQGLWAAQTPQVFDRELLLKAFAHRENDHATDEAELVERLGQSIHIVEGWPMNLKITTKADLKMAAAPGECSARKEIARWTAPFLR